MIEPVSFAKPREHRPRLSEPHVPGKHSERHWKPEEDAILREHYPGGGLWAVQALLPGRRQGAIYGRVNALGVKRDRGQWGGARRKSAVSDETIREEWPKLKGKGAVAELAQRLGVKRDALSARATRLGLTIPHKKEPRWTEAEDALLARAPLHDPERAAALFREHGFSRSPGSIVVRAKRLSLSRRATRHELSATGAAKILGVDIKWITARVLAGDLVAKKRGDQRLPQQGGSAWDIEPAVLRQFIFENPERIDLRKVDRISFLALLAGDEFQVRAGAEEAEADKTEEGKNG